MLKPARSLSSVKHTGRLQLQLFLELTWLIHFTVALISAVSGDKNQITIPLPGAQQTWLLGRGGEEVADEPSPGGIYQAINTEASLHSQWSGP